MHIELTIVYLSWFVHKSLTSQEKCSTESHNKVISKVYNSTGTGTEIIHGRNSSNHKYDQIKQEHFGSMIDEIHKRRTQDFKYFLK